MIIAGKARRKEPLGRPRHRWGIIIRWISVSYPMGAVCSLCRNIAAEVKNGGVELYLHSEDRLTFNISVGGMEYRLFYSIRKTRAKSSLYIKM
jgi:hypothetical protein